MCWIEEYELKHMEFHRCVRSFRHMRTVWNLLAENSVKPGQATFARYQSSVYRELQLETQRLLTLKGLPEFVKCDLWDIETLLNAVREFHQKELGWLTELARGTAS
jgi:hypothetical protein